MNNCAGSHRSVSSGFRFKTGDLPKHLTSSTTAKESSAFLPSHVCGLHHHLAIQPKLSAVVPLGLYSAPNGAAQPASAIAAKIVVKSSSP